MRSGAAPPADDHGPRLRLRGGQRRSAIAQSGVPAELDQTPDIGSQVEQGVWPRIADLYPPCKPLRACLRAAIRKRSRALRGQSVALGAGRRDRPRPLAWSRALRIARPNELSADRRWCLPCDARAVRILLVPAPRAGCIDNRGSEDLGGIRNACGHRRLEVAAARPFQIGAGTRCSSGVSCEPALVCRSGEGGDDAYRRRHTNRGGRSGSGSCAARGQRQARNCELSTAIDHQMDSF